MSYSILRFAKRTGGTVRAIEAHHERKKEAYSSNPDIMPEKTQDNYHLLKPETTYYQEINRRLQQAKCKVRSNSVKFVDTMITSDFQFFNANSEKEYFQRAFDFMCEKVGKQNIISAVVHLDEKTPHLHLCFVPLTADNRLTAKEILGNKAKMCKWQDEFHDYMQKQFSQLERGKSASETKRKHIPLRLFKQATMLSSQLAEIETALKDINILNASKKRDIAIEKLKTWFPQASSFICEIEKLKDGLDEAISQNKELQDDLQAVKSDHRAEIDHFKNKYKGLENSFSGLKQAYYSYKEFVDWIPENILQRLQDDYFQEKEQKEARRQALEQEEDYEYGDDD